MARVFGGRHRRNLLNSQFKGFYSILDLLLLIGVLYFLVKLFLVALPYALGFLVIFVVRDLLKPRPGRFF